MNVQVEHIDRHLAQIERHLSVRLIFSGNPPLDDSAEQPNRPAGYVMGRCRSRMTRERRVTASCDTTKPGWLCFGVALDRKWSPQPSVTYRQTISTSEATLFQGNLSDVKLPLPIGLACRNKP